MPSQNYTGQLGLGQGQLWAQRLAGPAGPTGGNLLGAPGQPGAGPYGNIPQVPSPISTQSTAIGGNTQNLAGLGQLGTGLNTQIAQQAALPYQLNLPNYGAMTGQSSQNILSLLQGQVPQDVANQIAQMGAERGVATGSIGSPNANAALLRSLGLTSLGLQSQGESELTGAVGRTPTGQQFNPASFLVSPQQQQEAQYLSNLMASAPDPSQNAAAQLANSLFGYNFANQQGYRQPSGFGPPPPSTQTPFALPTGGGQQPLGSTPYGSPTGTYSLEPSDQGFGDYYAPLDQMGSYTDQSNVGLPLDWQTGIPLDNYQPPDLFSGDLFGGGG